MKLFIKKLILHAFIPLVVLLAFVSLYTYQTRMAFRLPSHVDTVILGDSRTQNGVDDSIFENFVNFSSAAECYLYTFNKLRYILEHNGNVRTVVLSFAQHNLSTEVEESWLTEASNKYSHFGSIFPLFSGEELFRYFASDSLSIGVNMLESVMYHSLYSVERQLMVGKLPFTGGFTANNKLYKPSATTKMREEIILHRPFAQSQVRYLEKIQTLCREKQIKLFMLNTPVMSSLHGKDIEVLVAAENTHLDWSRLELPTAMFADEHHLNPSGARFLTEKLAETIAAAKIDSFKEQ